MQLMRVALFAAAAVSAAAFGVGRRGPGSSDNVIELTADTVSANFMSFSFLADDTQAFKDLSGSVYKHVPPHLKGKIVSTPDRLVSSGFVARWACPAGRPTPCDAYLFIYDCPPCVSQKGGLPALLNSEEWERSRCAPQFTTGSGSGKTHKMTAYKKHVAPGTTEEVTLPGDVEFVSFGLSQDPSVDCSALATQGACEDMSLLGQCQWNLGMSVCQLAKCVGYGPSPNGCLGHCVADDL